MRANTMIDSANSVLCRTPEAFNGVDVRIARDKDFSRVIDPLVLIAHRLQRIVRNIFIGKHRAMRHCPFDDVRHQCCALSVGNDLRDDPSFAFDYAENGSLTSPASPEMLALTRMLVLFEATIKAFIHLDFAGQLWTVVTFVQHRANLLEDAPRGFVGDAKLTLQLLGANAASRGSHQIHRIEPELERCRRVLKDCTAHWMLVASAKLTAIGPARCGAMMLGYLFALWAEDPVGIEPFNQLFKARGIIWVLALEVHQRVGAVRDARADRIVAIGLAHPENGTRCRYIRQGDTYRN